MFMVLSKYCCWYYQQKKVRGIWPIFLLKMVDFAYFQLLHAPFLSFLALENRSHYLKLHLTAFFCPISANMAHFLYFGSIFQFSGSVMVPLCTELACLRLRPKDQNQGRLGHPHLQQAQKRVTRLIFSLELVLLRLKSVSLLWLLYLCLVGFGTC